MQIDRYNHLSFPRDNTAATNGKDTASGAAPDIASTQQAKPLPTPREDRVQTGSVVLKIQFPNSVTTASEVPSNPVYSNGRKQAGDDDQRMARDHQLAIERNAGVFTQLAVNKDGVLVAKQQPSQPAKEPDFVALAVSAMREFSDEHERQKVRTVDAASPDNTEHWTAFKGLQQFAAKLNVFA